MHKELVYNCSVLLRCFIVSVLIANSISYAQHFVFAVRVTKKNYFMWRRLLAISFCSHHTTNADKTHSGVLWGSILKNSFASCHPVQSPKTHKHTRTDAFSHSVRLENVILFFSLYPSQQRPTAADCIAHTYRAQTFKSTDRSVLFMLFHSNTNDTMLLSQPTPYCVWHLSGSVECEQRRNQIFIGKSI